MFNTPTSTKLYIALKVVFDDESPVVIPLALPNTDYSYAEFSYDDPDTYIEKIVDRYGMTSGIYRIEIFLEEHIGWEGDSELIEQVLSVSQYDICPLCGELGIPEVTYCTKFERPVPPVNEHTFLLIEQAKENFFKSYDKPEADPKIVQEINLEGNNGGDMIHIKQTERHQANNVCYAEIAQCCVYIFKGIIPVEVLVSALGYALADDDIGKLLTYQNEEFKQELLSKVKRLSFLHAED